MLDSSYVLVPCKKLHGQKQWTAAYQWKSEAKVKQNTHDLSSYYTKAADGSNIDSIDCVNEYDRQMNECNWTSFASFTDCAFGMWKITMKKDENWKNGTCKNGPVYYKQFISKKKTW